MSQTRRFALQAVCVTLLLVGCAEQVRLLMPTPTLFSGTNAKKPFDQVPEARRTPKLDILYFTNRVPNPGLDGELTYGSERSTSLAFGSVHVHMGPGLVWEELVDASQSAERRAQVKLELDSTNELGRYPPSPYVIRETRSGFVRDPGVMAKHRKAEQTLVSEITRRLAQASRKEVVLYVHGFNESFEDPPLSRLIYAITWVASIYAPCLVGRPAVAAACCVPTATRESLGSFRSLC